jgi:4-aminobutyrate aminotransferase-like enzyme
VSLAAAKATLAVMRSENVPTYLGRIGEGLLGGLHRAQEMYPQLVAGVRGIPEMCFFQYADEEVSRAVTVECARRGLLFKRSAYNFVSLAHDEKVVGWSLGVLEDALSAVAGSR